MAYQFSGADNESLIASLKDNGFIKSKRIENVMAAIDRKHYCPENAYQDNAVKIGFGATISAPHMHAICLEALAEYINPGDTVLDVGCGSGYVAACAAHLVGSEGKVVAIDHIPELVELSENNVSKYNQNLMQNIIFKVKDGREGYRDEAPYNAIHVGAAAISIPQALTEQLKIGGRLLLPVVDSSYSGVQHLTTVDKQQDGRLVEQKLMAVKYVPLASVEMQMTGVNADPNRQGLGTIDMLNDDTLLLIFSYLMQKEWLIAEMVCHRWFILIRRTWRSLKSIQLCELLGVKPISNCGIQYYSPMVKDKMINGIADRCSTSLTELTMGCRAKMLLTCFNYLALDFPKLSCLNLSNTSFITANPDADVDNPEFAHNFHMATVFGALKELSLESCFDDSMFSYYSLESADPILFKLFSSMPIVETVNLGHNTMLNGSSLMGLSTSVTSMDLSFCRRIQGETLSLAFSSLPNLKEVSLYSQNRLTGACLTYLPSGVLSVDLSFCDNIETHALSHFLATHTDLLNLQLAHVRCVNTSVLEKISQLKYLEKLNLNSYYRNSYMEQLQHPHDITKGLKILKDLKLLKNLDVSQNDYVNDAVLIGLSYGCLKMEDLNVSQLFTVTPIGFASLGRLLQLKKLDLSCNECIDDTVLLSVAHGGHLEFVNARGCQQINENTVKRLSGLWPNNITVFQVY